jgi:UDP-N-acetylglucosamine 4,6-dehydratase/5-epimerase
MVVMSRLKDKIVLITGGSGSFGRAFVKRALLEHEPAKVIVFSRDEWKQWEMRQADPVYEDSRLRYFLGDVRDRDRLRRAFADVDVVIHAAALKQVPAAEYNPTEFVRTNVDGAINVIDAAIDAGVGHVVALSTDKAVNPINLYGATKLCSDKLFVAGNVYVGARGYPKMSVVRYGNVLGSRGSIIPYWQKLVREGASELPITDERMTRFWLTVEHGVDFVIESLDAMQGGEIFVPKLPSMKIIDLAEAIAPGIARKVIGARPGEKVHELLIPVEDALRTYEWKHGYYIAPHGSDISGAPVALDFSYASDTNSEWLTAESLRATL